MAREVHFRQDRELLGIDVRLQEAIEQHQRVRPGLVEAQHHLAGRAEVGTQLDRDRHADGGLDVLQDIDVTLFDLAAGDLGITGEVVDVQLDRGGAGVLHRAGVFRPPFRGDAVEARDHGNVDGRDGALQQDQVTTGAAVLFDHGGEVVQRLGKALGRLLDEPDGSRRLLSQLLLEQREHDDRPDAAVRQPLYAVEGVRQRRWGRHQRIA